jgi:hypothetical protein
VTIDEKDAGGMMIDLNIAAPAVTADCGDYLVLKFTYVSGALQFSQLLIELDVP